MAYGARLESVLGESPRGFESPILRQRTPLENWDVGNARRDWLLHPVRLPVQVSKGSHLDKQNLPPVSMIPDDWSRCMH